MRVQDFDLSEIRAIATDLDGTALNSDHKFDPQLIEVMDRLVDKGYRMILATGRPRKDVIGIEKNLKHQLPLVTANGAVLSYGNPAPDMLQVLDEEVVRGIASLKMEKGCILNVYTTTDWYVNEANELVAKYFADTHFEYNMLDINTLDMSDIIKIFFIDSDVPPKPEFKSDRLIALQAQLKQEYGNRIECVFSQVNCLEVNAANVNKANTINAYLNAQNLDISKNLICFGDGMNDALMMQRSRYGFVMENADPNLKAYIKDFEHVNVVGKNTDLMVARILNDLFELGFDLEPYFEK